MAIPPRFKHFILRVYDSELDYASIAERLFDGGKWLVVKEDKPHEHVHWQGLTSRCEKTLHNIQQEFITQQHRVYKEKGGKGCRLVSNKQADCTALGFQYMSKQTTRVVLTSSGFTEEDLAALYVSSVEHNAKLKTDYNTTMWKLLEKDSVPTTKEELKKLIVELKIMTVRWYKKNEKMCPFSRIDDKVKNCILHWPKLDVAGARVFFAE